MPAFLMCDAIVKDPDALKTYLETAAPTVERHGGKFLVNGGCTDVLEGDWNPKVVIIAEFPSMEAAHEWYGSEDYAKAFAFKERALTRNMVLVEGLELAVD